jgi:hypothetical protein
MIPPNGAPAQDVPPVALSGASSILGRLLRLEQHFRQMKMGRTDRELWGNAQTLRELGELTAQWLEGDIESQVGYAPYVGPSDETQDLIPTLAALNRAGYLTIGSQPGTEGGDGQTSWMQEASVQGFADDATLARIRAACEDTDLVVRAYRTPRHKWPFRGRLDKGGPLAYHACGGNQMGLSNVQRCLNGVGDDAFVDVLNSWQVAVIDPVWTRNDLLWPTLTAAVTPPCCPCRPTHEGPPS